MDYHNIGFQECIAEVAKYLSVEGLDLHDPLRVRLMSHLHNITAQREFASKQTPWYPGAPPPPPSASQPYQPTSPLSPGGTHHLPRPPPPPTIPIAPLGALSSHHNTSLNSSSGSSLELNSSSSLNTSGSLSNSHSLNSSFDNSGNSGSCEPAPPSSVQSSTSSANTSGRPLTTTSTSDGYYLHHITHQHSSMELYHHHPQHLHQQHPYGQTPSDPSVTSQMKQVHRPWGAEVAY